MAIEVNGMRLDRKAVIILVAGQLLGAVQPAFAGYFPQRPAQAQLQQYTGVIIGYGSGEGIGAFALSISGQEVQFYIGRPMTINGSQIHCMNPGTPSCTDWPTNIVLGATIVTATCWTDTTYQPGGATIFCDEIDTGIAAQSQRRSVKGGHTSAPAQQLKQPTPASTRP
jgi:hypothetical protein